MMIQIQMMIYLVKEKVAKIVFYVNLKSIHVVHQINAERNCHGMNVWNLNQNKFKTELFSFF
jgi:spore germination protein YaaH